MNALTRARSFLFVPANRCERIAKAFASGADVVIVDLEDAVAPQDKAQARQALGEALSAMEAAQRARLLVRINASTTTWFHDDLSLLGHAASPAGVLLAKAEAASDLRAVAGAMGSDCALLPLIESLAGLDAANELARAPQVARLVFGHLDFQVDLGLACEPEESELLSVRLALVAASRRAGIAPPVDGVTVALKDEQRLQTDAARSRRMGFGAKLCIHPSQVALVNQAFSPSADELDWAQRVVAASQAAGGGAFSLDGRMVDPPVLLLAQQTLARAQV
jgi:citrate lyase subunit beta/citryl-CoA lyase